MDHINCCIIRFVHWWDRNEEDAQESLNESLHLIPHYVEHLSHMPIFSMFIGG